MRTTYLTSEHWNGSQSINYQATAQIGTKVLRVTIKRDSYDMQSHAFVEFLTEAGWTRIHSIHDINAIRSGTFSAYDKTDKWKPVFAADGEALLKTAATILSAAGMVAA